MLNKFAFIPSNFVVFSCLVYKCLQCLEASKYNEFMHCSICKDSTYLFIYFKIVQINIPSDEKCIKFIFLKDMVWSMIISGDAGHTEQTTDRTVIRVDNQHSTTLQIMFVAISNP